MAEAEELLIGLAERATAPLRERWAARFAPVEDGARYVDAVRVELHVFLVALFGRSWGIQALPPPRSRGRLLRRVSRRVRSMEAELALSYTDGRHLYLAAPQDGVLPRDGRDLLRELRCTALLLAARCVRQSPRWIPHDPLARDLFWIADARASEHVLTRELPGLERDFETSRQAALARRPAAYAGVCRTEERIEAFARAALGVPSFDLASASLDLDTSRDCDAAAEDPRSLAQWAERTAREWRAAERRSVRYRGMTPVSLWGRPARLQVLDASAAGAAERPQSKLPSRTIRAQAQGPTEDLQEEQRGSPLLVPPGDPMGSVEAAGRTPPPPDSGDEDLETLAEELERLQRVTRVRSERPVKEVLESDACGSAESAPQQLEATSAIGERVAYPEWDHRARRYRPAYCIVHAIDPAPGDPVWGRELLASRRSVIRRLRQQARQLRPEMQRHRREPQGGELDLEAYVESHADRLAAGLTHDRLYIDTRRKQRDLAVALLIDASASTDRWLDSHRRVIDLAREAALLFCESASAVGDRHALFSFSGDGPNGVRVAGLKSFSEEYGPRVADRIAGLEPDAYTRLGGALRHVARALSNEPARRRLLLLLSDGRPNDHDEYEGRYGIEDTRRAVAEMQALNIRLFCVNIDRNPAASLAHVFGQGGYATLRRVDQLPEKLSEVYRDLARG